MPVVLTMMAAPNHCGFLSQNLVTVSFDFSSPVSKISPSIVHTLDLAAAFTESGHVICTTTLIIPTQDGHYSSCLDLIVGYDLSADVVLGADWVLLCHTILNEDHTSLQRPNPSILDSLPPPHNWYPVEGVFIIFSPSAALPNTFSPSCQHL